MESTSLDQPLSFRERMSQNSPLLLLVILMVAAIFRLYKISGYMEFLGDQGRDVVIVRRFLKEGDLMFIGPQTSIGNMYLGPWYYYLMAPFLLLSNFSPVGPAIMAALFGVATVWLIWKAGKEWFGKSVALLAALFFAISPVAIYYSIFSWNPNIMPFFSLLSVWLTWRIWKEDDFKKLPWLGFSLAMVLNSHYLGLLLFPPIGFFLLFKLWRLIKEKKKDKKKFVSFSIWGLVVFILLMSPLVLFDLKHDFVNFQAISKFFAVRQTTVNLKFYKGLLTLPKIVNQLLANLFLKQDSWPIVYWLIPFLLAGLWKLKHDKAVIFCLVFLLVGILGLANYKQHVYAHYFGVLWPMAILFVAVCLRKISPFSLPVVACLIWVMVNAWHGWQNPNFQLNRSRQVASFIMEQADDEKFALALIAEQNYDPSYRYFLESDKIPLVNLHQEMPEQLFVICEPWGKVDCNPIGHSLWEIASFGWAEIAQEWELEGIRVFKLIHYQDGQT